MFCSMAPAGVTHDEPVLVWRSQAMDRKEGLGRTGLKGRSRDRGLGSVREGWAFDRLLW